MKERKIQGFFNKKSVGRNIRLESDPILKYEQDMRQKGVIELLKPKPGDKILDVGCGNARDLIIFAKNGARCVGIDFSENMIKEGKKDAKKEKIKIDLIVGGVTKLPFKNDSFYKMSCSEVIEHIPNYGDAIEEMTRVLKNSGRLVVTTPNKYSLYGLTKFIFRLTSFVFSFLRKNINRNKKKIHPYDKWKTKKELIEVFKKNKLKTENTIGICFIPGQITYFLPKKLKKLIIKITEFFEEKFRWTLNKFGYIIGMSLIKKGDINENRNTGATSTK